MTLEEQLELMPVPVKVSKFTVNEKEIKNETTPNPIVLGGIEQIGLHRLTPIEIPKFLFMHPALPRGIELKANRMIKLVDEDLKNNVKINPSEHPLAKEAMEYNKKILADSGGALFLKKMAMGAFRFGTSFSVLQTNKKEDKVLRFEYQHPIYFAPARYPKDINATTGWEGIPRKNRKPLIDKMKIDETTKKIKKYTQLTEEHPNRQEHNFLLGLEGHGHGHNQSHSGTLGTFMDTRQHPELKSKGPSPLKAFGPQFDKDKVFQLMFDTLGDEPLGISLVQFLHLTIKYLIGMERGGAQTQINFGFNKWKANTPFSDPVQMRQFAQSLARINTDAVVVLPKDIELDNIQPGKTDFADVHPIYLRLIAMRLGIPMPLLIQDGTSTNKSTIQEQRIDMYDDFIADELTIEMVINEAFFKSTQIRWKDLKPEEIDRIVPRFKFKQPPEDLDKEMERNLKFSLMIRNYSTAAKDFWEMGDNQTSSILGLKVNHLVLKSFNDTILEEKALEKIKKLDVNSKIPPKELEDNSETKKAD